MDYIYNEKKLSELKKQRDSKEEKEKMLDTISNKNSSACCNAPIDYSRVIKTGRHKGHGGRYCSKCGKCVFWV